MSISVDKPKKFDPMCNSCHEPAEAVIRVGSYNRSMVTSLCPICLNELCGKLGDVVKSREYRSREYRDTVTKGDCFTVIDFHGEEFTAMVVQTKFGGHGSPSKYGLVDLTYGTMFSEEFDLGTSVGDVMEHFAEDPFCSKVIYLGKYTGVATVR